MSTQNVNVARFAHNVECDFVCNFQPPWVRFCLLTKKSYDFRLKVSILFVLNWMYICLIMCLLRSSFSITQIVCLCVKLASCLEIAPVFECLRSRAEWQQVLVVFQLRSRSFLKERKKKWKLLAWCKCWGVNGVGVGVGE